MTEALEHAQDTVLTHLEATEIAEPGKGALDFPAPLVPPQLAAVLIRLVPSVAAVRHNELDASSSEATTQGIAVVAAVGDDAPRPHPWPPAPAARHPHGSQGRFG